MLAKKISGDAACRTWRGAPKNWRAIFETSRLTPTRYRSHSPRTVLTVTLEVMA
jgi:hypothetical protein